MKLKRFLLSLVLITLCSPDLLFAQAPSLSAEQEEQLKLAKTYDSQVVQYYQQGLFKKALPLAKKAWKKRKEILGEKHPETLISLNNLALIYKKLGSLSHALPLYEKGYRFSKEVLGEKHPNTLLILNNLAMIYNELGRLSEALPLFEKGYRLSKEVLGEKHPNTLLSLNNLAMIYQKLGRLSEALPLFEKGYRLSKEVLGEKHPNTLLSLNNLAILYQNLGRLSEALPLYEKGYRLSKEVLGEKHPNTLLSLNNLAMIYQKLGRLSEALPLFEKGYSLYKEVLGEKHPNTLLSLNNLAMIYNELGRLSEALPLFEKGYRLYKEVLGEKHPNTLLSLNNLAIIYQDPSFVGTGLGRSSQALPLLEKGYRLYKEELGEKHPDTLNSLSNLAYAYLKQGKMNQAIKHYETFVTGVESLRSSDLSAENRRSWFKKWVHHYFWLSLLYTAQSRPQDAFRLTEMSKARTLLESMAAKIAAQQSGLTTVEQKQLQGYETRIASLNHRIAKALEKNRTDERVRLETEKNQVLSQRTQFERKLKAKYPKYAKLSEAQIIAANEGATLLPAEAVFISYLTFENSVLAFTLQANGQLTAHNLGEIPSLEKDLETYRRRMARGRTRGKVFYVKKKDTQKLSSVLGKRLLEPLKDIIKDKPQWIISPSSALAFIPFETLRFEGEKQPVIVQHQISYVQSLSVLAMLQERDKAYKNLKKRGSLFAMGAPIYESVDATKQPTEADLKMAERIVRSGGDSARALRQLNIKWKNLPGTLQELEQLGNLFFLKKYRSRIFKQADATEANLQRFNRSGLLAKYRYLVFSAHGYLSPQVPELSAIVLGQVNNPSGIDGYITAGEWAGYNLKSDLMVLSACETGLGKAVSGEGVMGLPYALYVAGNKNTILTLWSISDEVTTEFITSFFVKLKAGVGQVEALTATKREFIKKGGDYSKPKYWAAFVLYGI
jgi:CHAT domain-containing protein/exonuclease VII small subunit